MNNLNSNNNNNNNKPSKIFSKGKSYKTKINNPSTKKKEIEDKIITQYIPRQSQKFKNISNVNNDKLLITDTSLSNLIESNNNDNNNFENTNNSISSLIDHNNETDILKIDMEANSHYDAIDNNNYNEDNSNNNTNNSITDNTNYNSCSYFKNLSSSQIWLILIILSLLIIITLFLYLEGYTDQIKIIWDTIFCLLGIMECKR